MGREGSPGMAMLGNNGCWPIAKRNGVMPIILLMLSYVTGAKPRPNGSSKRLQAPLSGHAQIQSLSILIVHSTCPLALLLPMVMWWWMMPSPLQSHVQSCPQTWRCCLSRCSMACPNGQPGHHTRTRWPSSYVARAQCGSLPTWRMDPQQQGGNNFHPYPMEIDLLH